MTAHDSLCAVSKTQEFEGCVAWCPVLVTAHEAKVRGVIPHVGERAQIMAEAVLNISERLRRTEMFVVTIDAGAQDECADEEVEWLAVAKAEGYDPLIDDSIKERCPNAVGSDADNLRVECGKIAGHEGPCAL